MLRTKLFTRYSLIAVALISSVLFAAPKPAAAGFLDWVTNIKDFVIDVLGWVLYLLMIKIGGVLATTATTVLVYVAQLNNFTNLPAIVEAWQVVRDLSNMFFIVILLVIAFGTLFRIEAYSWKKLLPKMVLAAILVNFSRAICGVIVDASQVIMLTFVAAIKDAASVGLAEAFNLGQLLAMGTDTIKAGGDGSFAASDAAVNNDPSQRLVAIVAAGFMLMTLLTVQCVYIVILVGRMVMIWFLTVLSPLAYVMRVLPQTERYSSQWWELFGRYVTVGPLAMFFLWLAMFIAAKSIDAGGLGSVAAGAQLADITSKVGIADSSALFSQPLLAGFVVATLMLMAGMKLALENSSELGAATGKAADFGKLIGRAPVKLTAGAAAFGGKSGVNYANDWQFSKFGVLDFNLNRVGSRWKHGFDENKKARVLEGESKAGQKYREGYFLAGAFGAGDQVAELGFSSPKKLAEQARGGVFGNIPILRGWAKARRAPGILGGRQGEFERALEAEKVAESSDAAANRAYDTSKAAAVGRYRTVDQYTAEEAALKEKQKLGTFAAGVDLQLTSASKSGLLEYRAQLQAIADSATSSTAEKANASSAMTNLDSMLSDKKREKITAAEYGSIAYGGNVGHLTSGLHASGAAAGVALGALQGSRDALTNNMSFINPEDIESYVDRRDPGVRAALAARTASAARLEKIRTRRSSFGSQMGAGAEKKAREFINDAKKHISTNDTSELQDGLEDALHKGAGYGPEALAYIDRLFETGNENDMMRMPHIKHAIEDIMRRDNPSLVDASGKLTEDVFSYHGFKALEKHLQQRTGLGDQLIRASLHRGFQHAKANGHFIASEMTELKNGQVEWRSQDAYEHISEIEANKKEPMQRSRTYTRLEWGDGDTFYEGQRRRLENYAAILTRAQSTDGRLQINLDKLRHIWADKRRYHVQRNAIIRRLGKGKEGQDAVRAYNEAFRQGGFSVPAKYDTVEEVGTRGSEPDRL